MKFLKVLFFALAFSISAQGEMKEIVIDSFGYGYVPQEIVLQAGEKVKLILSSSGGNHGLASKELGFNLKATDNKSMSVEITPEKSGTYKAKCSVPCGSGHSDMSLNIIVK